LRLRNGPEKKSGHHRPGNTFLGATENQRSRRAKRTRARPEGSRMANPPRQGSNFLEYNPAKEVLSQEAWNANSALTFYKLLKNLRQTAKLLPLVHPQTNVKYMVDWPFVEGDLERQAMPTYLGGQGAVNVTLRKTINDLVYTYLIKLLTPCWPRIEKALVLTDYDDDASPHHVLNVHGHITERMPMVARLISAIKKKTFKGPVVHNKSLEDHIQGFKGPKDASDQALTNMNAWLDETDTLWTMLQAYPECLATEGQRWTELLRQMKVWSVSDSNKFPTDIFINDMRARATSTGVKSLSDLITSFSTWIEAEILERQASKSNKVIGANATTPSGSGCAKHGPNAKHTTAECKGLMKRPQGQQSQRTNGKAPFNEDQGSTPIKSTSIKIGKQPGIACTANALHSRKPTKPATTVRPAPTAAITGPNTRAARSRSCSWATTKVNTSILRNPGSTQHSQPTFNEADRALQVLSRVPQATTEHQATPYCLFRISRDFPRRTTTSPSHSPLKGVARNSMTWTPYSVPMKATTLKWKK
jgi:hypothetical protein